ncbi:MAG: O-antigen ligase family protein [Bacteroidia bacterium]|nr:O-antigen ligase family protein [Bacteroidia bacterium]
MESNLNRSSLLKAILIVSVICGYEFLSFFPEILNVETRVINIPFRLLMGLACIIILFNNPFHINKKVFLVCFFWLLYLIRFLYETIFNSDKIQLSLSDYWGYIFLGCLLPMLAFLTTIDKSTLDRSLPIIYILLLFVNVFGLINNQGFLLEEVNEMRAEANIGLNSISFATCAISLIVVSLYLRNKFKFKILIWLSIILAIVNIGLSGSRGPILQLVLVGLLYLFMNTKKVNPKYIFIGLISFSGIIYYLSEKFNFLAVLIARFTTSQSELGGSDYERTLFIEGAWNQFRNSPLIGDSVEVRPYGIYPHNMLLESFMSLGILGGILCFAILIIAFVKAVQLLKYKEVSWLVILFLFSFIATFTTGSIVNNFRFWTFLSFILIYNPQPVQYSSYENCDTN